MPIFKVALDVPLPGLFDYRTETACPQDVGKRVLVNFGRRKMPGIILDIAPASDLPVAKLQPILRLPDDAPPLPGEILGLLRFCSQYYHHPIGQTVFTALPQRFRQEQARPLQTGYTLTGEAPDPEQLPNRAQVRRKLLAALKSQGWVARKTLLAISSSASRHLREMADAGWLSESQRTSTQDFPTNRVSATPSAHPVLTGEQAAAVGAIQGMADKFASWLLLGITGSGKTEVYLRLAERQLDQGRQVLVLVPEINLTPQLEARFKMRFPDYAVVSLHSNLNDADRFQNWLHAESGTARIVMGTRLAVFTPMPNLGLIIVDEEHDGSFKQQDGLRYHARDVAVFRARQRNIPIVLGSATPSLETWQNAQTGRYQLLKMTHRAVAEAALPAIACIDTRNDRGGDGLSPSLLSALKNNLEAGRQSLVFINRRGYAPVLACGQCGWLAPCPRCTSHLVVHLKQKRLRCHHCGHESRIHPACPDCGNIDLAPLGQGTQRLEERLAEHFPSARLLRIDRDSTRRKHALKEMLQAVHDEQVDILVGTQILAKGHDFKRLTLVGALNVDGALYSADFRAAERLFAQLMQVAGRAGRAAEPGTVLIQTKLPYHPLFEALRRQDYENFANAQLVERQQAGFPPFCHQALLRAEAVHTDAALNFLRHARKLAREIDTPVTIYDPVPASMARLAGRERAQLLVQADSRRELQAFLSRWNVSLSTLKAKQLRWSIDVDPLDF